MEEKEVLSLIAEGENERIEFKRELDLGSDKDKAKFVKYVVALANSAPDGGYLLIGVDDDKSIVGINELEEERMQKIAHMYVDPPVVLRYFLVLMATSESVGVIAIKATRRPHKVAIATGNLKQDEVFVRRGSVVTKASPEEILGIQEGGTWLLWGMAVIALTALSIAVFSTIQVIRGGEQFLIFLANSTLLSAIFMFGAVAILISITGRLGDYIELGAQRRIILAVFGLMLMGSVLGVSVSIAAETLSSFTVILGTILIPIGLISMSYLAIKAYRRQAEQKSSTTEKLRAKEAELFDSIEDDISALLEEEVK